MKNVFRRIAFLLLAAGFFRAPFASAVIVATSTPNSNTNAPVGDRGWSSMAIYNTASAVYLGGGWFITAGHLGTGAPTVNYRATNYTINSATWVALTNANGTAADARLFQISTPSAITGGTGISINQLSLSSNTPVTMIGYGRNCTNVVIYPQYAFSHYYMSTNISAMKWGTNSIDAFTASYTAAGFVSSIFETDFDYGEAQALDKDSGGGVFVYDSNSGSYLLAGLMIAVSNLYADTTGIYAIAGASGGINSSYYSKTYAVNLSKYSTQILNVIPEPGAVVMLLGVAGAAWLRRAHRRATARPRAASV